MRITRAAAGLLLLLALVLAVRAGNRCANCGLGEGEDPCDCGNNVVRAQKLAKPEILASPEAIKSALKLRSTYGVPSPSPVSYSPFSNYYRRSKNGLRPTSIAPKFEPIGDLCHTGKGYKDKVVGVVPARPPKPSKSKPATNPTSTPAPSPVYATSASLPAYSLPAPSQTVSAPVSYSAPVPYYNVPTPSYYNPSAQGQSTSAPFYSGSTVLAQYAPAYQTSVTASYPSPPSVAHYAFSQPQPAPVIYVAAPSPSSGSQQCNCGCGGKHKANPTPGWASAHQASVPLTYVAAASSSPTKRSYEQTKPQPGAQYAPAFYAAEAKKTYKKAEPRSDHENVIARYNLAYSGPAIDKVESALPAKRSYGEAKSRCGCDGKQETTYALAIDPAAMQYATTYQEPSAPAKTPGQQYNLQSADKDEREAESYVEIVLQEEQAPKYTADPISISLAYKNLADSQGRKHVAEDSLAYGHYKEPADGRACKHISHFDEEKLHTVDKPVVELKLGERQYDDSSKVRVSYSDIGYGPVAPSKNRFVPKTDRASNPSIIYVPPPADENGILGEPLGPTIPGYQSGGVILGKSNGKPGCGDKTSDVQEGSRQAFLVDEESEERDNDSYSGKGGIIERVKSAACKSGY